MDGHRTALQVRAEEILASLEHRKARHTPEIRGETRLGSHSDRIIGMHQLRAARLGVAPISPKAVGVTCIGRPLPAVLRPLPLHQDVLQKIARIEEQFVEGRRFLRTTTSHTIRREMPDVNLASPRLIPMMFPGATSGSMSARAPSVSSSGPMLTTIASESELEPELKAATLGMRAEHLRLVTKREQLQGRINTLRRRREHGAKGAPPTNGRLDDTTPAVPNSPRAPSSPRLHPLGYGAYHSSSTTSLFSASSLGSGGGMGGGGGGDGAALDEAVDTAQRQLAGAEAEASSLRHKTEAAQAAVEAAKEEVSAAKLEAKSLTKDLEGVVEKLEQTIAARDAANRAKTDLGSMHAPEAEARGLLKSASAHAARVQAELSEVDTARPLVRAVDALEVAQWLVQASQAFERVHEKLDEEKVDGVRRWEPKVEDAMMYDSLRDAIALAAARCEACGLGGERLSAALACIESLELPKLDAPTLAQARLSGLYAAASMLEAARERLSRAQLRAGCDVREIREIREEWRDLEQELAQSSKKGSAQENILAGVASRREEAHAKIAAWQTMQDAGDMYTYGDQVDGNTRAALKTHTKIRKAKAAVDAKAAVVRQATKDLDNQVQKVGHYEVELRKKEKRAAARAAAAGEGFADGVGLE